MSYHDGGHVKNKGVFGSNVSDSEQDGIKQLPMIKPGVAVSLAAGN